MKKAFFASIVGTLIEWFDFFLYAAAATLVINEAFFPNVSPTVASIASLSTFAVGFVARPLGAAIFGHFGDRIGRKRVLTITLVMMGVATLVTGLLPTYSSIGIAAPIILVIIRFVQGVGVGGEYGGAVLMVFEHSRRDDRKGLFGSFPLAAASAGFLLASACLALINAVVTDEQFQSWGWRIPFVLSVLLLAFGYWIRRSVDESPEFEHAQETNKVTKLPMVEMFRDYPRQVLIATAMPICIAVSYSLIMVYMVSYAAGQGVDRGDLLVVTTIAQCLYIPLILTSGYLSDRIGRRAPMVVGMIGTGVWAFAFWPLISTGSSGLIFLGVAVALAFASATYGPQAAFQAELFPLHVRYSGVTFGYQLAQAIAGGLSPVLAVTLMAGFGTWVPIAIVTAIAAAISLSALWLSRNSMAATEAGSLSVVNARE
ncbi:MFS transporter [Saccharopolyspora mangrovi]|uniref:MFS transporter n=1 Tax=Saccharopolyspora mangrovi TaxID=3082379 RepID=A0ABU6AGD5_9PSEU|nr:MFS transporter [Saccharopolyspora sp. S2-29]MEB3370517.1 MFS transporter [Saccharopolyspora sp. S2-29]